MHPELWGPMISLLIAIWYAAKMNDERISALREVRELKEKLAKLEAQTR